jgi:phosphoribosylaminoimidazolecarboxamide formyltransferase/IMP cyclohydrolase
VVVNFYPFTEVVSKNRVCEDEVIENIDIGGPALVRAGAKNFRFVTVVVDPADYEELLTEMKRGNGGTSLEFRERLAQKAFGSVSSYDACITEFLSGQDTPPPFFTVGYKKTKDLRYGTNPHQKGALYTQLGRERFSIATARQISGKELSYNNILDLDSAYKVVLEFDKPTCCIVKHAGPCGVACEDDAVLAFTKALSADSISAYGGVIAFNTLMNKPTARAICKEGRFFEAVVAPSYDKDAIDILLNGKSWSKDLRILEIASKKTVPKRFNFTPVSGGLLVETIDEHLFDELKAVTFEPTSQEKLDLIFAWKVAKHVKSNAIVLAKGEMTVGIGGGQPSRLDSVKIALIKAGERAKDSVMASDGFFPFKDGLEIAIKAGVKAVIQPGGSIRDEEIIKCARKHNIPMIFTGTRHFRH